MVAVSPNLTKEDVEHDEIAGGLFAAGDTTLDPQILLVDAPFESVAVIVTENVPADD